MEAVLSALHVKVKFPTEQGVTVVRGSQQVARQCLVATVNRKNEQAKQKESVVETPSQQLQNPWEGVGASYAEQLIRIKILPNVDRYFQVRASMTNEDKVEMLLFLMRNVDMFAWSMYKVPGVDPEFIVHKLNVDLSFPPKKQKPRRLAKEHIEAVRQEVGKLKDAEVIKEIFFLDWLANTMVVRKKNGKWRVCVDFTDLNRAYPKDPFPMPKIDQLVDATYGHPRMSFLVAFQGYHQIALVAED